MTKEALLSLLKDMTLEEKVMQLVQVPGNVFLADAAMTGLTETAVSDRVRQLAGSTLGIYSGKEARQIQQAYMERHPHHIPLLLMADVIHGHHVVFPCPLGLGATFDPELVEQAAAVQAEEAAGDGIHVTFSPMADLARDARWGRVMESTGEDKTLNSRMAAAMVRGYQGKDLTDARHVASCVKHFAAYGAADAGRDYNNTELSEHTLREYYLPAYEAAIKAGARLVMSSFNSWNGVPVTGSEYLLRDVLRGEMGFDGVVISDWDAVGQLVPHGFAEDKKDAGYKAMRAGVDIDMCTNAYAEYLVSLVEENKISQEQVDEAALRVLELKNDLGLFEHPFRGLDGQRETLPLPNKRALARKAVRESLVLLKNEEHILPLKGRKIAFIGPYAESEALLSSWSVAGEKEHTVSVGEAARNLLAKVGTEVRTAPGCLMLENDTVLCWGVYKNENWEQENQALLQQAKETAAWADTVVLCLGEHYQQSGESTSRAYLNLPDCQLRLLGEAAKACPQVVTLIFCGRPLELKPVADRSKALLVCWLPGTEGGNGILDVLMGKEAPSGKLPMSFPWTVGQEPLHYDQYPTGRPKPEHGPANYTSHYLDCSNDALYPFGFGLSYGDTFLSPASLSKKTLLPGETISASAVVTNNGTETSCHTVQLYIRDLAGSRVRPVKELKDFQRVTLAPGESKEVRFAIDESMLRFWRLEGGFGSEPGQFRLWIGLDSNVQEAAVFELKET